MKYRVIYRSWGIFGGCYQLAEDEIVQTKIHPPSIIETPYATLYPTGILHIKTGFVWDGASGPTFNTKSSMRGSLYHDVLSRMISAGVLHKSWRKVADELIRDTCITDGMCKARANAWYLTLRAAGGNASRYDPSRLKILTAP